MSTHIPFVAKLLRSAMEIGRMRTKRETVNEALKEFIERRQQKRILDLAGTIAFREDWNVRDGTERP